jgi:hypothetical protein
MDDAGELCAAYSVERGWLQGPSSELRVDPTGDVFRECGFEQSGFVCLLDWFRYVEYIWLQRRDMDEVPDIVSCFSFMA